jgi:hypothetical protein
MLGRRTEAAERACSGRVMAQAFNRAGIDGCI